MKRLFFSLVFSLVSIIALGQNIIYQGTPLSRTMSRGLYGADSGLVITPTDTFSHSVPAGTQRLDSAFNSYVFTGEYWKPIYPKVPDPIISQGDSVQNANFKIKGKGTVGSIELTDTTDAGTANNGAAILVNRTLSAEINQAGHGFVDITRFNRPGQSYASIDLRPTLGVYMGHYTGIQNRPIVYMPGQRLANLEGFGLSADVSYGDVGFQKGFFMSPPSHYYGAGGNVDTAVLLIGPDYPWARKTFTIRSKSPDVFSWHAGSFKFGTSGNIDTAAVKGVEIDTALIHDLRADQVKAGGSLVITRRDSGTYFVTPGTFSSWTIQTRNLYNNDSTESGNYGPNGAKLPGTSWIRTKILKIKGGILYTLSGAGNLSTNQRRFSWFDSLGVFIIDVMGNGTGIQSAIAPSNARYVGITLANVVGIGLDPTHSQYAGTIQFEAGPQSNYVAYGNRWDASKVSGVPPDAAPLDTFNFYRQSTDSLRSLTRFSKNRLNPKSIVGYVWSSVGGFSSSANWISTRINVSHDSTYSFSGGGSLGTGQTRFVALDSANNFIVSFPGNGSTQQTIKVPSNAATIGVNIANVVNIGLDPTNSPYAGTVMFEKSAAPSSYETFQYGIGPESIIGNPRLDTVFINSLIAPQKSSVDFLMNGYIQYSRFDTLSKITLPTAFTLNNDGDYLEFTSRPGLGSSYLNWLGMFGVHGAANTFGYYDATHFYLRENNSSAAYVVFTVPPVSDWHKFKLAVTGGGTTWSMYMDSVLVSTQAKSYSFVIAGIGDAYSSVNNARFDLKSLKIKTGNDSTVITDPTVAKGAANVAKSFYATGAAAGMSPVYVSYTPATTPNLKNGLTGNKLFTVFCRRGNTDSYVGYRIGHEIDTSQWVWKNYYRLVDAYEYQYTNGSMSALGLTTLVGGENECVWQAVGKADFCGGWHGDEQHTSVAFYFNNVQFLDTNTAYSLVPLTSFSYVEKSAMTATAEIIAGDTIIMPGHPKVATHYKKTTLSQSTFETFNRLVWDTAQTVALWYSGILCLGKMQATAAYDDNFNTAGFTGTTHYFLQNSGTYRGYYANNITTGYAASVTSSISRPANADTAASMFVWDRTGDSKYYRQYPPAPIPVAKNEIWESTLKAIFDKK